MTAKKSGEDSKNPLKILEDIFRNLFEVMSQRRMMLEIMNQPHDDQHQGEPVRQRIVTNPAMVKAEGTFFVFQDKEVEYRFRQSKVIQIVVEFINWATEKLAQITKDTLGNLKTLTLPANFPFFSVPIPTRVTH